MDNLTGLFPPMPTGADKSIIKPSASFKKQVYRSIAAIALFVVVYLLLFCGALAIGVAFGLLGVTILTSGIGYISLLIGAGLIIAGALLVFFVIKFLFKRTSIDHSGQVEISEAEQPLLFAFINQLTAEVGSPKPKRIFITPDVNASVSYNSAFWSMFLPVRKNLRIGLGLVNAVSISEFKSVMAHEFGHFSQRSMKFGSYVYNVNKVIYNMLFENEGYDKLLSQWARIHYMFRMLAWLNIYLIRGMQAILRKTYVVVNKTHMGLSREMEYHADTIAAYVSGSNQGISALNRLDIAQVCYIDLLNYLTGQLNQGKRTPNLYTNHSEVIKIYCELNNFQLDDAGLPLWSNRIASTVSNRIEVDDPWSSHPLTLEREAHLNSLDIQSTTVAQSAWSLFENKENLQEQLTDVLYATTNIGKDAAIISPETLKEDFSTAQSATLYNALFKNYFDNREINEFDIDEAVTAVDAMNFETVEELLSTKNCQMPADVVKLQQNAKILEQIIDTRKDVKFFYYQGIKKSRDEAAELKTAFEEEIAATNEQIKTLDKRILLHFIAVTKDTDRRNTIIAKCQRLFNFQKEALGDYDNYQDLLAAMSPVYGKMQPNQIRSTVSDIYLKEKTVKPRIREIINDSGWQDAIDPENLKAINTYLKTNWQYYLDPSYNNNAISVFNSGLQAYVNVVIKKGYLIKKDLLDFLAGADSWAA